MAVKQRFEGKPWSEWAEDIRLRWQNALDYYRRELYFEIEFQEYMQFKFRQQWMKLKAYANKQGIEIIGDIPIYVAMDSADTWQTRGCLSWMKIIAPHRLPVASGRFFSNGTALGGIPFITGRCTETPDLSGGSNGSKTVSAFMM